MTKQEIDLKLAELAGYEAKIADYRINGNPVIIIGDEYEWRPWKNMEQAMECLEGYYKNGYDDGITQFTFDCMYHDRPIMGFWLTSNHGEHAADGDSKGWDFKKMFCECIYKALSKYVQEVGS